MVRLIAPSGLSKSSQPPSDVDGIEKPLYMLTSTSRLPPQGGSLNHLPQIERSGKLVCVNSMVHRRLSRIIIYISNQMRIKHTPRMSLIFCSFAGPYFFSGNRPVLIQTLSNRSHTFSMCMYFRCDGVWRLRASRTLSSVRTRSVETNGSRRHHGVNVRTLCLSSFFADGG